MPVLRVVVVVLVTALLARQALLSALHTIFEATIHRGAPISLGVVAWTALASLSGAAAAWVLRPATRRERALGVALAGLAAAVLVGWSLGPTRARLLEPDFVPARDSGTFPHRAGQVIDDDRAGWRMRTVALADGTRACGSGDEGPVVVLLGDSFMYGSGVPDDGTVCWQLRERLAAEGLVVRAVNLGQPGASLASTAATLETALARYRPDVVVLSVLPGDDARPFDLNDQWRAVRHPAFQVASAILDPEIVWHTLALAYEVAPPDRWEVFAMTRSLERIGALTGASRTPVVMEVLSLDDEFLGRWYEGAVADLAARTPGMVVAPRHSLREGRHPEDPRIIPGDGHTTPRGNAERVEVLLPLVRAALAEAR